ncbi:uncharacterized protein LOC110346445 [Heterocephalus glaber]|uniref:Uncharacterized protein LOC110346445 n=1 Tax=Heterocephalus glaber TaxID=10181 RepID=A0AAX6S696_HETGA|nr:uncharacterized protein LOC110346445 [Heterocephalus glaber]
MKISSRQVNKKLSAEACTAACHHRRAASRPSRLRLQRTRQPRRKGGKPLSKTETSCGTCTACVRACVRAMRVRAVAVRARQPVPAEEGSRPQLRTRGSRPTPRRTVGGGGKRAGKDRRHRLPCRPGPTMPPRPTTAARTSRRWQRLGEDPAEPPAKAPSVPFSPLRSSEVDLNPGQQRPQTTASAPGRSLERGRRKGDGGLDRLALVLAPLLGSRLLTEDSTGWGGQRPAGSRHTGPGTRPAAGGSLSESPGCRPSSACPAARTA